jgi:hypothetical protein
MNAQVDNKYKVLFPVYLIVCYINWIGVCPSEILHRLVAHKQEGIAFKRCLKVSQPVK